jgi:ABC-type bacteriocin/lantibiotic exporter with double-glycine peptidase domain
MPKSLMIRLQHHQQAHSASCLAACVVMVLAHWQVHVSEIEVRRIIRTKPFSGTHPVNLLNLGDLGFDAWPHEGTEYELRQRVAAGEPVIAFLWTGALRHWADRQGIDYQHTVVVVGWSVDAVLIHDPALPDGPTEIPWAEFKDAWQYSRQMMAVVTPKR